MDQDPFQMSAAPYAGVKTICQNRRHRKCRGSHRRQAEVPGSTMPAGELRRVLRGIFRASAVASLAAGILTCVPAFGQGTQTGGPGSGFPTTGTTTGTTGTQSTITSAVPSAPAGTVPGGVQPATPNTTTTTNFASAPTSIQLGPVQGLGGGIRPPRRVPMPGVPLTLEEAIRISLANNLNIYTAQSQESKADHRIKEARTGFLPRIGLNANYTYTGQVAMTNLGGRPVALGTHSNETTSASVVEGIDTSGATSATVHIAEDQRDAQYWALDSARRQVILSTDDAYLGVLRSQDMLKVSQEQLADAQAHVDLAQKMLAAGTIAQYDLLTAQTSLANVQQQVYANQNALNASIANLDNAMGLSQETTFQLSAVGPPAATVPDFRTSLTTALAARPELKQIDANVRTAQHSVDLAAAGLKPNLGVQFNYNYTPVTAGFNSLHQNWTVGLVGSWDPFDWGATREREAQSRADVTTNRYLKDQTAQGIEYQVRQAINQISDSLQRRTAAETAVTTAREQLRLANVRYQAGAGTNTEVIDAEAALAQAETNSESALYDFYQAQANYQRATGTEPLASEDLTTLPPGPGPGTSAPAAPAPGTVPPGAPVPPVTPSVPSPAPPGSR